MLSCGDLSDFLWLLDHGYQTVWPTEMINLWYQCMMLA